MNALNAQRAKRTRIVGVLASLYTLGMIVALIALRPQGPPRWMDDAPPALALAAAHDAVESHPFGALMVPYEHRRLERAVRDAGTRVRDPRGVAGTVYVYHIVLGEMTWLLVGILALGLLGALLAVKAGPMSTIWSGVLLLLAVPGPIASVGPGSIALTLPLLLFGILVLVLRPRAERPEPVAAAAGAVPATAISGPATTNPGREIAIGVGLIILGIVVGVLAANMGGSRVAKVWIGAAASLGMGLWLLISGLIHLGQKADD